MHCPVIKHGMTLLRFQTALQKNEAKLKLSVFLMIIIFLTFFGIGDKDSLVGVKIHRWAQVRQ